MAAARKKRAVKTAQRSGQAAVSREEPGPVEGEAAATWERVDSLVGWEGNPRDGQPVEEVAASIKAFGFGPPVVARRESREISVGHTRVQAAVLLGMQLVPVRFLDLSANEAHQLAIADNKLGEKAKWTKRDLGEELAGWHEQGVDLELLGFTDEESARLMGTAETVSVKEIEVSELRAEFFLSANGPLPDQPEFLERLREALANVQGVHVVVSSTV
jgi:ParB-like chromosome segregation protein Spo0J